MAIQIWTPFIYQCLKLYKKEAQRTL